MNPFIGLLTEHTEVIACFWTVCCIWLGFRMGSRVVMPLDTKEAKVPKYKQQSVDIDNTHDDPWEAALNDPPEERITGDLQ